MVKAGVGRTPSNGNMSDDDSEIFGGAIEEVNEAQFLEEVQLVGAFSLPSQLLLLSWRWRGFILSRPRA